MEEHYPSEWHRKYFHSDRIHLLSDGVYAIVMTLLVLDLKIPTLTDANSAAELWEKTKEMLPHFWSFLITFLWIANTWVSGQSYARLVVKNDSVVVWLQVFMLMLACLYPFPTAIMGKYPENPMGVIYFGIVTVLSGFLVIALTQYTLRKGYISSHVDHEALKKRIDMVPKLMPIYFVPLIIAFWFPIVAQIIYFFLGITWIFQTSSWKLKEIK